MHRFFELLESRRLFSASPMIQADVNQIRSEISSLLADEKRAEKLTKPDLRRLKIDFRHATPTERYLLSVFNSDVNRVIGDLKGSLSFLRHVAGHDLPLALSASSSLQKNPGNPTGEALRGSAISWLTTDRQTGGLLADGVRLTGKAQADLSAVVASLPTNAPALRDLAKVQTDLTNIDAPLQADSASFTTSMQQLITNLQS